MCKNLCERMNTKAFTMGFASLGEGWKKCRTCCISIKTDNLKCQCCKRKLSTYIRYKNKSKRQRTKNMKCLYVGNASD